MAGTEKSRRMARPRAMEMSLEAEAEMPPVVEAENFESERLWGPKPQARTQMAQAAWVMAANWTANTPSVAVLKARMWVEAMAAVLPPSLRKAREFPQAMSLPV